MVTPTYIPFCKNGSHFNSCKVHVLDCCTCVHGIALEIPTRSHRQGTKSLGRSRDKRRKDHLKESFLSFSVFEFITTVTLVYIYQSWSQMLWDDSEHLAGPSVNQCSPNYLGNSTSWRLFYHVRTAHRPFGPIHDCKTRFKGQKPTLINLQATKLF